MEVEPHAFLPSSLDGDESSALRPVRFSPWQNAERPLNMRLDRLLRREYSVPACLESNPEYCGPAWSQTLNTVVLPGVKPGILCACLESNPEYSGPAWSQTRNTLVLPGVKPGILCARLKSNSEYCSPAWSQTRNTVVLHGVKPGILWSCLASNPVYSAFPESNPVYSVPALSQALIIRLPNTWSSHYTN